MARRTTKKKTSRTASFDGVGKGFAEGLEYLVTAKEVTVEDGDNGMYYSFKLEGNDEFEGSLMYHNASLSPAALWKTRDIFAAFLGEDNVPEGDFDVDEYAEMFVGQTAMCGTFKDTYNGQSRIKPEDFWPAEEGAGGSEGGDEEVDLDELEDDDIKAIGKALGIKSKRATTIRKELEEADADELMGVLEELGLAGEGEGEEEDGEEADEIDLDELDDDDLKAIGKAAGMRISSKTRISGLKKKLEALTSDELAAAAEEAGIGGKEGGEAGELSADDINGMNQDELEELVEEHELEVDLDDHKTLRKKRTAVVDAAEEAGLLEED